MMFKKYLKKHLLDMKNIVSPGCQKKSFFDLYSNINPFSCIKYHRYPQENNPELAAELLKILPLISFHEKSDIKLSVNNILFVNGSVQGIDLLLRTFCEPKEDAIIITSPTFPYYAERAQIENVAVVDIPLLQEDFDHLNIEKILSTSAKIIFLCSPNNPVGTCLKKEQIVEILNSFRGIVVIDEAYIEWSDSKSCVDLIYEYENLVILRSFSKIWGLAGIRAGFVLGNRDLLACLNAMNLRFNFADSTQNILKTRLKNINELLIVREIVKEIRTDFVNFLTNLEYVKKVYPSEANFILVNFDENIDVFNYLLSKNIMVQKNTGLPYCLRISISSRKIMNLLKKHLVELLGYKKKFVNL